MSLSENLRKYLETTPREKVLEDWAKTKEYDSVGPTADEFIKYTKQYVQKIQTCKIVEKIENTKNPEYSGFFFTLAL